MIPFAAGQTLVTRGTDVVDEPQREVMAIIRPQVVVLGKFVECAQSWGTCQSAFATATRKPRSVGGIMMLTCFCYRLVVERCLAHVKQRPAVFY